MTHDEFRAARKRLELTQAELAQTLGYGKRQVWSYEHDVEVPPVVVLAMLALLDGHVGKISR